ncbi:WhiB family transcriptional regulator [Glycomyces paridis]|uniref:WhiB family transcriptional regulator n=1 Tax=Glycomyces paridis TaxID=2126555 RepID=UPI001F01525B|nr:WhiB family transcriptional regulator [Glycomyces paridis]
MSDLPTTSARVGAVAIGCDLPAAPPWLDDAACLDVDTALFFSDAAAVQAVALAVCATCPVTEACWRMAVETGSTGVWGGTTHLGRRLAATGLTHCAAGHELTESTARLRSGSGSFSVGCRVCDRDRYHARGADLRRARRAAAKEATH